MPTRRLSSAACLRVLELRIDSRTAYLVFKGTCTHRTQSLLQATDEVDRSQYTASLGIEMAKPLVRIALVAQLRDAVALWPRSLLGTCAPVDETELCVVLVLYLFL